MLGQPADRLRRHRQGAGVGRELRRDQTQQRALAGSAGAGDHHPLAGAHPQRHVDEQRGAARVGKGHVAQRDRSSVSIQAQRVGHARLVRLRLRQVVEAAGGLNPVTAGVK